MFYTWRLGVGAAAAVALLCVAATTRSAAAQRVWGDPEFLRAAEALGLQREGPVPAYGSSAVTATPQAAPGAAAAAPAADAAPATARAAPAVAAAGVVPQSNFACRMDLDFALTSKVHTRLTASCNVAGRA